LDPGAVGGWQDASTAPDFDGAILSPYLWLIHGGNESWPVAEGVTAIALVDLMRKLVKN